MQPDHFRLGPVGDFQHAGGRLLDHAEAHHRYLVASVQRTLLYRTDLDARHVSQSYQVTVVAAGDDQILEVGGGSEAARDSQGELPIAGFEEAGRQFDVLALQRIGHIVDGQLARGQGVAIQPDPHRVLLAAAEAHPGHSVLGREAVDEIAVGIIGQLRNGVTLSGKRQPDDDVVTAVALLDFRRLGLVGQVVGYRRDPVANVVGGAVDIAIQRELDVDLRFAIGTAGFDRDDALDTGDAVFEQLGDARLDDTGGGARVVGLDADDGRIDGRILLQRQALHGQQAEGDQQQRDDGREDRTTDR